MKQYLLASILCAATLGVAVLYPAVFANTDTKPDVTANDVIALATPTPPLRFSSATSTRT